MGSEIACEIPRYPVLRLLKNGLYEISECPKIATTFRKMLSLIMSNSSCTILYFSSDIKYPINRKFSTITVFLYRSNKLNQETNTALLKAQSLLRLKLYLRYMCQMLGLYLFKGVKYPPNKNERIIKRNEI